ncbi:MAG: TolC family protein [Myxococcales bacterium]|nr:TolC family protein [Myxococcales bacterium]
MPVFYARFFAHDSPILRHGFVLPREMQKSRMFGSFARWLLCFLAVWACFSWGPAHALTRQEAVEFALKQNPSFRVVRANIAIAMQRLRGWSYFPTNPELETVGKVKAPGKPNPLDFKTLENELIWKMPIGGWWTQGQKLAQAFLKRVKREVEAYQFQLTIKVHRAYNKVLISQEKVSLYKDIVKFFERIEKLTVTMKAQGAATILNVNLVRLELWQNRASLQRNRAKLRVSQQKLAKVLGWDKTDLPTATSALPSNYPSFASIDTFFVQAADHIRLLVAKEQIKQAEVAIQFAEAKAIPDLKLKVFYALEQELNHTIGIGFSIPIPFTFRNQPKIFESRAKLQQARLKLVAEQFKLRQSIRESFLRYTRMRDVLQIYQTQLLPQFKQQLRLLSRSLQLGNLQLLQLVTTQKSQLKAMLDRLDTLEETVDSYVSLFSAIGKLPTGL